MTRPNHHPKPCPESGLDSLPVEERSPSSSRGSTLGCVQGAPEFSADEINAELYEALQALNLRWNGMDGQGGKDDDDALQTRVTAALAKAIRP